MKNKILFIACLLIVLIPVTAKADNISFDPKTRILSTDVFSMKLSDHWGSDFEIDEDTYFILYSDVTGCTFLCTYYLGETEFLTKDDAKTYLEDGFSSLEDILIEFETEQYLDGYIKTVYTLYEDYSVLNEGYCFVTNDNKGYAIMLTICPDDGTANTSKQIFRSDLKTIIENNSEKVIIYPYGNKYHNKSHLSGEYYYISLEEAISQGYEPCTKCYP